MYIYIYIVIYILNIKLTKTLIKSELIKFD